MQFAFLTTIAVAVAVGAQASVQGFDVSYNQSTVDFNAAYSLGARFVIIQATEGNTYIDPLFSSHYAGATDAGLIRGGYHIGHPGETNGATQADYFVANGGGWAGDGITLPGVLELEASSSSQCWGLATKTMTSWIREFSSRYHVKTGRYPLIYTSASWWSVCTANSTTFVSTNPLVLADYGASVSTVPGGWGEQAIWQTGDAYPYGGNSDIFNGSEDQLLVLASG